MLYLTKVEDLGSGIVALLPSEGVVCGPVTGMWRPQVGRHQSRMHGRVLGVEIKDKHGN